jgi:large subunit ribosomal protein L23
MNTNPYYIIKSPLITEESTIQRDSKGRYTFKVEPKANKRQIREAIEKLFNVKVVSVNTMNYDGKLSSRRGRSVPGFRPNWKKAIVTLQKGDAIDLV